MAHPNYFLGEQVALARFFFTEVDLSDFFLVAKFYLASYEVALEHGTILLAGLHGYSQSHLHVFILPHLSQPDSPQFQRFPVLCRSDVGSTVRREPVHFIIPLAPEHFFPNLPFIICGPA